MLPFIYIFNYPVPLYGVCIFLGIFIGTIFSVKYFLNFHDLKKDDLIYAILYGLIGLAICAKLLYILIEFPNIIESFSIIGTKETLIRVLKGGFVFYGGLIGLILGIFIYSKQYKVSFKSLLLTIVPAIPLVHAFGRIGCFCAGCCYGMEYTGFGHVIFPETMYAPSGIALFPSQLVEAFCNLIIFIVISIFYKKYYNSYKVISIYLILYSIVRFILEFFRGDVIRGFLLGLSTSQWISIALFIIGIIVWFRENKKNKLAN